ncbi:MAG: AbiV family abortive infection protein [Thermoplasmata archaeon]|nr:AbiV family abortive infection protein [Thermoplasmata archaeon]NIS14184.1 AbiV family abortive infection protein [Thermoplasmata archaeon]NIS22021.1 AbiV family abortive infection protein [Thermoplasmata archaeon]NIT79880.1 AbiV family abortive infection protein [Thermoplasmata archaeon]NIU51045.1 AbiV family abortive infection protein [Thermoplasmata archaeon]
MVESLDPEAVVDGMILCSNNASKLADDARIMMIFKRHSTAGLLAITALEEAGKVYHLEFILSYLLAGESEAIDWKEFWMVWKRHSPKFLTGVVRGMDFSSCFEAIKEILSMDEREFKTYRNRMIHVDRAEGRWISPFDVDEVKVRGLVKMATSYARELSKDYDPGNREFVVPELQELAEDPEHVRGILEKIKAIENVIADTGYIADGI